MAARQDLLTAPNRAIPGSWQPAPAPAVEESLSSLGCCRRAAGTALGEREQSLGSAPDRFLPTGGRDRGSSSGVKPEDGNFSHGVTALAGKALAWGHGGTEQGGISRQPTARRMSCLGTGHGHRLRVPWPG